MILCIYDYFRAHKLVRNGLLFLLTSVMALSAATLSYKEDISDFLPLKEADRRNMELFQDISRASEIVVLFDNPGDEELTVEAIESFREKLEEADKEHWTEDAMWRADAEQAGEIISWIYDNIPYFLTQEDYLRMDSLLSDGGYVGEALQKDVEMLMFPSGGFVQENIGRDPLGLFTPVLKKLQRFQRESDFEEVDGYIFTPDMSRAIVLIHSPFGNRETDRNRQLLDMVHGALDAAGKECPQVKAHVTGGPVIAVGNALQIKKDSVLAITMACIFIFILISYAFNSVRNFLLVGVTVAWGALFALAGMSLVRSEVSLIVLGISSVIMGIAFNYPLHLINHLSHQPDIRLAMKEIVSPLLIGNVTTVGAFMALVPLDSVALRDLGIFASLMLLGTILFVLLFLPHYIRGERGDRKMAFLERIARIQPDRNRYVVAGIAVLTLVFAIASLKTEFDSDISNINYMTEEQRQEMEYFRSVAGNASPGAVTTVYSVAEGNDMDEALALSESRKTLTDSLAGEGKIVSALGATDLIASSAEQRCRLEAWCDFVQRHREVFGERLSDEARRYGFSDAAFDGFRRTVGREYEVKPFKDFSLLTSSLLKGFCPETDGKAVVVEQMSVPDEYVAEVEARVPGSFDIKTLNSKLSTGITDDFNYIGWACSAIVFLFLWYSFRNIRLAVLAFIPMAVSWVWILGIMALAGIKFNIVNIILATFIFGQGDDYTIFMTEGCVYEHREGKPMLTSYKTSIILSALIMLAGIGILVFASHPAMYSLGIVTVIGMSCVVLMAFVIPPFLYRLLFIKSSRETIKI